VTNMTDTPDKNEPMGEVDVSIEEIIVPDNIAEILEMADQGLPATHRCDRCGAQAYIQVEIAKEALTVDTTAVEWPEGETPPVENAKEELLFCVHHYHKKNDEGRSPEEVLTTSALRIIDHRGFLARQERMYKGQTV